MCDPHIDDLRALGLTVNSVVITRYEGQPAARIFANKLESRGITTYTHAPIPGYPSEVDTIVSDQGYGANPYIRTEKPIVVVTAPGPGSGKLATCLSQLYHEHQLGNRAGYAKFETFPVWNLPLKHPVNLAYEAATADLNDVNMIDPFHLQAYGETTVNYNRAVEVFPVLSAIFEHIMGESPYKSPTDMGVNMIGSCIVDDEVVCEASRQEILRRYYDARGDRRQGKGGDEAVYKLELLMKQAEITDGLRPVVAAARDKAEQKDSPAVAIELPDGRIVTGKTSALLGASAAALLNAVKVLGGIADEVHLISPAFIEPIQGLKTRYLGSRNPRLHTDEVLIALSMCAATDQNARIALDQLPKLRGCQVHTSVMLSSVDINVFKKLGLELVINDMGFDAALLAAQNGQSDIAMAGITVNEDRLAVMDFTDSYATGVQVVIVKEGSEVNMDNLGDYQIGTQLGTTGYIYASDTPENGGYGEDHVIGYESGAVAVQALVNGQVDAVVIDNEPAKAYVAQNPGLKILDTEFAVEDYAIGLAKGNTALLEAVNAAMAELKADGTFQGIVDKYITAE